MALAMWRGGNSLKLNLRVLFLVAFRGNNLKSSFERKLVSVAVCFVDFSENFLCVVMDWLFRFVFFCSFHRFWS